MSVTFFLPHPVCPAMGRGKGGRGGGEPDLQSHIDDDPPAAELVESEATSKEAKKAEHDRQRYHAKKIGQFPS